MRPIDANAYASEMKARQDALKELMDDAVALDNWEMYDGLSRAFSVFVEAKLTLDAMPTVDAVPVVRCEDCVRWKKMENLSDYMVEDYGNCSYWDRTTKGLDWCNHGVGKEKDDAEK